MGHASNTPPETYNEYRTWKYTETWGRLQCTGGSADTSSDVVPEQCRESDLLYVSGSVESTSTSTARNRCGRTGEYRER
ncbi:MAG: hypothetical protein ABEI86_01205, partial [Halobacteriaceae archaeon]